MEREASNVDMEELAKAFESKEESREKNSHGGRAKPKKWSFAVLAIGVIVLVVGLVVFIINKNTPKMTDADFLVSAGEWQRDDQPTVIWDFTKIGDGKLTTDRYLNDYDFIWSLDGNKLKIETSWLYDLNDEFEYVLDQNDKVLTIKNADRNIEVKFKAKEREKEEANDSSTGEN